MPIIFPSPPHTGHAPSGLLKLKRYSSGRLNVIPSSSNLAQNLTRPEETGVSESLATLGRVRGRGPLAEGAEGKLAWPTAPMTVGGAGTKRSEVESPEGMSLTSAKFIYVIPDFNNPTGKTLTLEERKEIVALARELDILIVEDSPYRELRYSGETLPTLRELAPERTLHLGSFSKIFAPGFRLGWIIGPEPLLEQIYVCKQCLDLCPPVLDQYMACEFLTSGALDANLVNTIAEYKRRRDLMLGLLEKYMPAGTSWTHPDGGLFLWLTLPESIDTVALYDEALAAGVAYVAGSFFYPDGSRRNTMRLNFSFIEEAKMEPGIKLLAAVLAKALTNK